MYNNLERRVTCCAWRLWDNFHQVWRSTSYPCLNYGALMLIRNVTLCDLDLWPVDLESSWYIKCHVSKSVRNLSEIEQPPAKLLIILRIFAHVMSRRDLDLWAFDLELLQHFECHAFKLCTKFERNRIIHGRVIDDLARFHRAVIGVGNFCPTVLRAAWTQLHQTRRGHRAIISTQEILFQRSDILAPFSNAGGSKFSDVENDAKFRTFRLLWKLGEGWARSFDIWLRAAENGGQMFKFAYFRSVRFYIKQAAHGLWSSAGRDAN